MPQFFSRGFEHDPNFFPNWRALQAMEYTKECHKARASGESYSVPPSENDELVLEYFTLLTTGDCLQDSVKYAHSCNETNRVRGYGTMIQSMLVGGMSVGQIADELCTFEENIQTYLDMFFDVQRYMDKENIILSIVSPYVRGDDTTAQSKQNFLWLGLSYAFGWPKASTLLQRKMNIDQSITDMFVDVMKNCLNMQAAEYVLSTRTGVSARPSDFERYISQTNATALSAASQSESMSENAQNFRSALLGLLKDKTDALPPSHPARQMIEVKEAQIVGGTKKIDDVDDKKFVMPPIKRL